MIRGFIVVEPLFANGSRNLHNDRIGTLQFRLFEFFPNAPLNRSM